MGNTGPSQHRSKFFAIPWYLRLYLFGIQGLLHEILFTSIHEFIFNGNDFRLKGETSIHAFVIYGLGSLQAEYIYFTYLKGKHGLLFRSILYILLSFFWEFLTGLILSSVSACPWDYSDKPYNIMGLITLDYAPGWMLCGWIQEVLSNFLLRVHISSTVDLQEKMRS